MSQPFETRRAQSASPGALVGHSTKFEAKGVGPRKPKGHPCHLLRILRTRRRDTPRLPLVVPFFLVFGKTDGTGPSLILTIYQLNRSLRRIPRVMLPSHQAKHVVMPLGDVLLKVDGPGFCLALIYQSAHPCFSQRTPQSALHFTIFLMGHLNLSAPEEA